jgi:uncharacterized membrane protein YdjX (TVP38/TMEM64 family)
MENRATSAAVNGKIPYQRMALGLAAIALLYFVGREAGAYVPRFALWVESLGVWGPVVFILGYVMAVVAFVPGSVMTLAGGAIFGLLLGVIYVFIAALIGSAIAFLIARYLARDAIERRLASNPRFAAIDRAVGEQGRKIVFLLRLSPLFPFSLMNYGLGLTRVSFADYMSAAPAMLLGTTLYVYYGKLIGDVAALAGGAAPDKDSGYWAALIIGLLATAVVTTIVTRIARRALSEATGEAP